MIQIAIILPLLLAGACSTDKRFHEDQCYQPLYWPSSECERVPRPALNQYSPPE